MYLIGYQEMNLKVAARITHKKQMFCIARK
jgi:hypothetical protein